MIATLLLLGAWGLLGSALVRLGLRRTGEARSAAEVVLAAMIASFACWLAASWLLALAHLLVPVAVGGVAAVAGGLGAFVHVKLRRAGDAEPIRVSPALLVLVLPVALWGIYVALRSLIVPVENHDAIAYHLPRAVLFLLDGGYRYHGEIAEPRLTTFPANYELLVANVLVLGGSDAGTILLSFAPYIGLGLVGASLSARWWQSKTAALVGFGLVASSPIAILHSGAHKNDLLLSFFAAAAIHWVVPWASRARAWDAALGIAALGMAVGTKSHGAMFGAALAPFLVAGLVRARSMQTAMRVALWGLACVGLLGGAAIVENLVHTHALGLGIRDFHSANGPLYGDWANLWRFPVVVLAMPFTSSDSLWVPWASERYWWNEYDVYFGQYGAVFSICALAVPFVEWKLLGKPGRLERIASVAVPVVIAAFIVPLRVRPYGFFIQEARYFIAIIPFVIAWSCGAVVRLVERRVPEAYRQLALLAPIGVLVAWTSVRTAINDGTQAFAWVAAAAVASEPVRSPPVQAFHRRVGYLVDDVAGPRDVIAVDVGFDTWLYPMFGKDLRRPVRFLQAPAADAPLVIPPDVTWVAIDRGHQEFFFTHPEMVDLRSSLFRRFFGRGKPAPENFVILERMKREPGFELVYYDPRANQALFHRRP